MDFRFTQDQQDLIEAARAVFDGENTVERMRAMAAGEEVDGIWEEISNLGLLLVMIPENQDGLGQPLVVMAAIAEAAGYAGVPEPYVEVAGISLPHLSRKDLSRALRDNLRPMAPSSLRPYLDHSAEAEFSEIVESIDPLRRLKKEAVEELGPVSILNHGAILTAAQLIGLSKRMLDMSVDYAKDRHQFGKPIGSFQAVKHQLANVHTQIEFTRPIIHLAALKGGIAIHNAKVAAIDTAMLAAETAIQVHGGMGYTFEVDLHLFMKRAWALCGEWGDRNYHMNKLEDFVLNGDTDLGPGHSFSS